MATPQQQPQPCRPKPSACRTPLLPESPLQVKVVGLFKSSSFQMSKTIAEVTLTPSPQSLRARQPPASVPPALAGPRSIFRVGECVSVWVGRGENRTGKMVISAQLCIEMLVHVKF